MSFTIGCPPKKDCMDLSNPVKGLKSSSQWGLGRQRTSKIKSVSEGVPYLNPKDWNRTIIELSSVDFA